MARDDAAVATAEAVAVVNAGSSGIKLALFGLDGAGAALPIARGEIDHTGTLVDWIAGHLGARRLVAAGHRVVLGGLEHTAPALVDEALLERLQALVPLDPLHLPRNLEPIEALARLHPGLPQVACFDTAFHRTMPPVAQRYALPRELTEAGARRYGFHGLSYEFIAGALRDADPPAAAGRTVVAHLGSGASLCALVGGRSVATSMGFSPLSGIMMGTRAGDLDPGLLLWLASGRGMDLKEIETMLYRDCGLLGVSGISGDMRVLLASGDPRAREAIDLFVYRIVREIGSLAAAAGGLDALVFTAGIGENAPAIRAAVCRGAAWLGLVLDEAANAAGGPRISAPRSTVGAWVIATNEELMVARHTAALLARKASRAG